MPLYSVEVWSLASPAAVHEDRILTATVQVQSETEEDARAGAALVAGVPEDYWRGVRSSAVGLRYATRYRRGTKGERIPETVIVGHIPLVLMRVEVARAKAAPRSPSRPRVPFNTPHLSVRQ